MSDIKVLFTDLDGTLLNNKQEISPGNRAAIRKALALGHKVVMCTGRPLGSTLLFSNELGLIESGCYVIAFNGGVIYDCFTKRAIYSTSIPFSFVRNIFDEAYRYGLHCQTYSDSHIVSEHNLPDLELYRKRSNIPSIIVPDVTTYLDKEPVKLIVIDFKNHNKLVAFQNHLASWTNGRIDSIFSCDEYLEYVSPGVSKGHAMKILCSALNLPLTAAIAAGDAENDISMLEAAHTSVVMKNGTTQVKAYADYITKADNNHDGIAELIYKYMI